MRRKHWLAGFAFFSTLAGAGVANAAPTMEIDHLPITPADYTRLRDELHMSDDDVRAFAHAIESVEVYADHANPAGEARNNRSLAKKYYAVPHFAASKSRAVVGGDHYATYALTVLDSYDELLQALNFDAKLKAKYSAQILSLNGLLQAQRALLVTAPNDERRQTIQKTIRALEQEIASIQTKLDAIVTSGEAGAAVVDPALMQAMQSELSRIGITPTASEQAKLASGTGRGRIEALDSMRARASNGQLGFRQAVFESGLSPKEKEMITKYLSLRPDVQVQGLNVAKVYARPTVQTYLQQGDRYQEPTVYQIRGLNSGGPDPGACGSTRSCNVVMEFTESGSRDGKGSQVIGQNVLLPVYFEGIVQNVAQPEFDGEVSCHFLTGWQAKGRADVKDGAIIYDGDVYNNISFSTVSRPDNGCKLTIRKGSQASAEWAALKAIDEQYTRLLFERQQASRRDMEAYRHHVQSEIQRHANQSQQRSGRGGWFSDVLGFVTGGNLFWGIATWFVGETRDFYWHTRVENTSVLDQVDIYKKFLIGPDTVAPELRTFDGVVNVCWAEGSQPGVAVMQACPDLDRPTTQAEVGNDFCPEGTNTETCGTIVDSVNTSGGVPASDPEGGLTDPWG